MLEGQSTHRPPLFIGSDYGYWKNRMIMYIKGQDYHVWKIIANGPHIPTKTVEGATLAKLESEWNEADVRLIELNCKAMSTLYCALDPIEYNRVSGCDSAKEIWDKLEVTYEGTNQVKESKMNMLVHEYELFVMKKDENISEMSTRFTNIVNSLKALGKIYTNQENVRKILRSLPKRWEAKMTAISEARDLKVLTLEELFGSLMTYELEMNSKVEEEEVKPKKNFALKSSHHDHDNSEEERDEEEEIALMTRNFKKFLKKKKGFGRRFPKKGENKGESSKTETPTCYKCKKQGHYKNECPQVNKEKMKYKKKALKVTWDDSDESDSDNNSSDNEVANLCLLGYINESNISEDEHASFCPLAFNDDESATEDLCLMAHGDEVCLISKSTKKKWFLDSGCSRHMTGDKNKFTSLTLKDGGNVKFGDNSKGKIIGIASSSNQVDLSEKVKDQVDEPKDEEKALPPTKNEELPKSWNVVHSHPKELIIGEVERGVSTRSKLKNICNNMAFLSQIEPKNINEAIEDESWILAMQEELNQFERNKVWTLAPRPKDHSVIGTKWVFRNKKDEEGIIVRNKARLVAQGYNQEEGIDYGETYAPVARLEAIRMLLAFACFKNFKLFQMDVKSAFLNGFIAEEVYVEQPPGFENHEFPNHVFKLSKALYGLKQAPRAWYERLSGFLIEKGFTRGKLDTTLFLMFDGKDMLIVQIYVDDIIFGSTNENLCKEFSKTMQDEFEMSMMGELKFFLGLQIKQTEDGIFLNQSKYVIDLLKRFGLTNAKAYGTPMSPSTKLDKDEKGKPVDVKLYRVKRIFRYLLGTIDLGLWYPKSNSFDLISYTDADFAGCKIDRKSTSGTCHFLGHSLVSWFSKKQNSVALSTAEAEYVAAGSCCAQSLYIKQQLEDFKILFDHIPIRCDNTSAISLSKNPIQHSRTKHIEIRYHFIRDHVQKGDIELEFVSTDSQWADILTKPLIEERFCTIRREIGMARYVDIK
uniref:CCHC-type domain-containing protein n=1 Tax=Fagus sylvatica TaxID=28930 RepID=A0A2N9J511_FAGSY